MHFQKNNSYLLQKNPSFAYSDNHIITKVYAICTNYKKKHIIDSTLT